MPLAFAEFVAGFEIVSIGAELAYRDHRFLRHSVSTRWPALAPFVRILLRVLPDPILLFSGSITNGMRYPQQSCAG